jgi:hypothetical protein
VAVEPSYVLTECGAWTGCTDGDCQQKQVGSLHLLRQQQPASAGLLCTCSRCPTAYFSNQIPRTTMCTFAVGKKFQLSAGLCLACFMCQTGRGLTVRLEVFKTKKCGWGVRSWDRIMAGQLVAVMWGKVHRWAWAGLQ